MPQLDASISAGDPKQTWTAAAPTTPKGEYGCHSFRSAFNRWELFLKLPSSYSGQMGEFI
jgi:hypothetical protein